MDIKEYISSGIIESYVLGTASKQEMQEVECMSHIYPEIKEELNSLQAAIENMAVKLEKTPPTYLKSKILDAIKNEQQDVSSMSSGAKVVNINTAKPTSSILKYAVAASVVITIGFAYLFYNTTDKLKSAQSELAELNSAINENKEIYESKLAEVSEKVSTKKELIAFLQHSATKKITLAGTDLQPSSSATVYWNNNTSKVYMQSSPNMPELGADKQYQLWAIVDGKPVDMGVLAHDKPCDDLCPMPDVSNAQAFAITIEKAGGSPTPSLDQLVVIGNV